eukprot:3414234-Amphidinium_carterae.2
MDYATKYALVNTATWFLTSSYVMQCCCRDFGAPSCVQFQRHFGHLRLAVSQCGAAAEWFPDEQPMLLPNHFMSL